MEVSPIGDLAGLLGAFASRGSEAQPGPPRVAAPGSTSKFDSVLRGAVSPTSPPTRTRPLTGLGRFEDLQPEEALLVGWSLRNSDSEAFPEAQGLEKTATSFGDRARPARESVFQLLRSAFGSRSSDNGVLGTGYLQDRDVSSTSRDAAGNEASPVAVDRAFATLMGAAGLERAPASVKRPATPRSNQTSAFWLQNRITSLLGHLESYERQLLNRDFGAAGLDLENPSGKARAGESARGLSPGARQALFPNLIYTAGAQFAAPGQRSALANGLQVAELPDLSGNSAIRALQSLLDRVRQLATDPRPGHTPGYAPGLESFLRGRLDTMRQGLAPAATLAPSAGEPSALLDSVRQAQAALADMAERMQGQVEWDAGRLRAVIHLEPPVLGRLHVDLRLEDGNRLHAHVQADQEPTEDFLRQHQSDLRQGLAHQGFDPEDIDLFFGRDLAEEFEGYLEPAQFV